MGESHGDARMGLARIFGLCAALLFASSVATAATIDLGPSDYTKFGPPATHTGGGVRSGYGQSVRLPPTVSGPTRILPVSRNAVIPYGSIANGAKNFARINPSSAAASAAITALFLGLDWAFDPELDSWAIEGDPSLLEDPNLKNWLYSGYSGRIEGASADEVCRASVPLALPSCVYSRAEISSEGNTAICRGTLGSNTNASCSSVIRIGTTCPAPYFYSDSMGGCVIEGEWQPVGDADFQELAGYLPSAEPDTVASAASDIQRRQGAPLPGYQAAPITGPASVSGPTTTSTSTDPVTGDTTVTTTNTTTNISYGDTTITTTDTTTSTTYQNGQETSTTVTTETPGELPVSSGGGAAGDWPRFCDWATVVCDWLNWTQEDPPPEQDLPSVIDDDFYEQKNISFGAKSCPPDYEINLSPFMDRVVGVSFQPLCDFAGIIYFMVMAASYIIAAYISIGVARSA